MRTFGLVVCAFLLTASAAAAQVSTLQVIEPPVTNTILGPRTLSPAIVACTDLPVSAPPDAERQIVASHSGTLHSSYAPGEVVVLNGGTPAGYVVGQRYYIRRLQPTLTGDPPSVAAPGAVRTAGWLSVIAADERSTLARIDFACDAVVAGDYLEAFVEPTVPGTVVADGPANFGDMGRVLFGADRRQSFGAGDVLTIDRGKDRGVGVGSRIAFYRDRLNGTPLVEIGVGVVVESMADTSKVVLTRAREAVLTTDYAAVRGTAAPPQ